MTAAAEMPEWLLVVDPGKTSGIALIRVDNGVPSIVWSDELDFTESCNLANKTMLELGASVRVLCESFVITPMTGKNSSAPFSLELIGVIKYLVGAYGCQLVLQSPSKAKTFCPNPRLKAVGFWHRGGSGHARDALRHAVTHLVDCGWHHEKLLQN